MSSTAPRVDNSGMSTWLRGGTAFSLTALAIAGTISACSASGGGSKINGTGGSGTGGNGGSGNFGGFGNNGGTGGGVNIDGGGGSTDGGTTFVGDPTTCQQAKDSHSYIGCDFWPTVVSNNVWSIFDYAVIVANAGTTPADVTIERNGSQVATGTVQPNGLHKFYLPWVKALKGPDTDNCGTATPVSSSLRVPGGAYHLTSSVPVTVYQFNALEYKPAGGPSGKNWSSCPGDTQCNDPNSSNNGTTVGCYSFSNDASLLLPSTAATGNYRVTGVHSWTQAKIGAYFAVTGLEDGTTVKVKVAGTGQIVAGSGVQATSGGGVATFPIGKGEVVEVLGDTAGDLSGSLVQADKPVQVITGIPCIDIPVTVAACDHIEESVFPAETLGKHYFVEAPTGPAGKVVGQMVRIYGNVDGTALTYPVGQPSGAPSTINAGQVALFGPVGADFEVKGNHEFAVGLFMLGGQQVAPLTGKGDPSQSLAFSVEQYRTKYVFLAPTDYDVNYADIVMPVGASVSLDGSKVTPGSSTLASSGYGVARVTLGGGANGAHVLVSDKPVGLQVLGYGLFTSYQYPGGLNLKGIAKPPPPIQ